MSDACLTDLVLATARAVPDAVAVVAAGRRLTYAELVARASGFAYRLRGLGVGTDTPVAVCLERGLDMVVALVGIQLAGGAYVPLDPDHPADRLRYVAADIAARVLVTSPALDGRIAHDGVTVYVGDETADAPERRATPDSLAYLIYTSGSTGRPKGVGVPHRGVVNRIRWMQDRYGLRADDVVLQKTPYGFDVSVWEFFWPLAAGARLVMADPGAHRDPARLAAIIDEHAVTTLHFVPTMLAEFLAGSRPHPTVRRLICSGEALPRAVAARAREVFGPVHNLYGPTEASIDVSHHEFDPATDLGAGVPIGRPIAHTTLHVLGPDLAEAETGELFIGGVGLARGYHGRPALTAERFVPDPAGGGRLYRTGDLVRRRADGELEFLGRTDHQVKIRGNRVELGEIESALADLPGVTAAAVIPHRERLVAYVAGAPAETPAGAPAETPAGDLAADLAGALRRMLPEYMVPSQFVVLDRLPVTSSGKTDRAALPEPPELGGGAPARTEEEALVLALWREVLGSTSIGVDDDFLSVGGDSIRAIRLAARARRAGLEFSVADVLAHRTVAALAPAARPVDVEPAREDVPFGDSPLPAAELAGLRARRPGVEDVYPLTPSQEGMLFHWLLDPDAYTQIHEYDVTGADATRLAAAWRHVLGRHPALRTTIEWDSVSEPVQVVLAAPEPDVRVVDDPAGRPAFDLAAAPPVRVRIAPDGRTVLAYHHALLDGWSVAGVLAEVMACYRGVPDATPVVPFRRYVTWRAARDPGTAHWRSALAGPATPPPRPAGGGSAGPTGRDQVGRLLPDGLLRAVTARAAARGFTAHTAFAAAWARILARYAGTDDVTFGVTVAGRAPELPGVESMVGLLVNTIPLRVRTSAPDLLAEVQRRQVAARDFEHASPVDIARAAGRAPDSPLYTSILVFQNHPPLPDGVRAGPVEESTGYPLTLVVELDDPARMRLLYRPADGPPPGALLDEMVAELSR